MEQVTYFANVGKYLTAFAIFTEVFTKFVEENEWEVWGATTSYYVRRLSPPWIELSEKAWYAKKALQDKSKTACEANYVCNEKNREKMKICWTNRYKIM